MVNLLGLLPGGASKYIIAALTLIIVALGFIVTVLVGNAKLQTARIDGLNVEVATLSALVDEGVQNNKAISSQLAVFDKGCASQLAARQDAINLLTNKYKKRPTTAPMPTPLDPLSTSPKGQGATLKEKETENNDEIITNIESLNAIDSINGYFNRLQ